MRRTVIAAALLLTACAPGGAQVFHSSAGDIRIETIAIGLANPWSLAFLPDGRMLVTERPGRMRIVADGKLSPPIAGVPAVTARSQAGLLDVALDRGYAQNHTIYFCFNADTGADVAVARARLNDGEHAAAR